MIPSQILQNLTIQVPVGTTQHGNERILCLPVDKNYWPSVSAVILFFLANYFAHAATVKSSPGDGNLVQACNVLLALMFPMSGLLRALNAIVRNSGRARDELDKACKAGALCMVVRERHWSPRTSQQLQVGVLDHIDTAGDVLQNCGDQSESLIDADLVTYFPGYAQERSSRWVHFDSAWARSRLDLRLTRVHGAFELPEGYGFAVVPRDTYLVSRAATSMHEDERLTSDISATYSALKAIASLLQVIAAFTTLLSHRADLLKRWGYASYHLTVIPYLFMTIVNLISNCMAPDYSCMYMVRTETMREAESLGGRFEGEVAQTITLLHSDQFHPEKPRWEGLTDQHIKNKLQTLYNNYVSISGILATFTDRITHRKRTTKKEAANTSIQTARSVLLSIDGVAELPDGTGSDARQTLASLKPRSSGESVKNDMNDAADVEQQSRHRKASFQELEELCSVLAHSPMDTYRLLIPRAQKSSLGAGFLHTLRTVMKDFQPQYGPFGHPYDQTIAAAVTLRKRLGRPKDPFWRRLRIVCLGLLSDQLIPKDLDSGIRRRRATVYIPNCEPFLRHEDLNWTGATRSGTDRIVAKVDNRAQRRTWSGILIEILLGTCLIDLFVGLIAGLTSFHPGDSSQVERGIMLTWLISGLYGFCLPLLSVLELLKILLLFPIRLFITEATRQSLYPQAAYMIACLPFGVFVPPIWGFVLVGRMLVEWGGCIRLY